MYDPQKAAQQHADREAADLPMFRQSDPETSRDAAARVLPHLSELQARVRLAFQTHGALTAKEAEQLPEFADLGFSTVRKRISELVKLEVLASAGVRDGSTVYQLAGRAQRQGEAA